MLRRAAEEPACRTADFSLHGQHAKGVRVKSPGEKGSRWESGAMPVTVSGEF